MTFLQSSVFVVIVLLMIGGCGWATQRTYIQDDVVTGKVDIRWMVKGMIIWFLALILPPDPPFLAFSLILVGGPVAFSSGFAYEPINTALRRRRKPSS